MKVINAPTTAQVEALHGLWGHFQEEVLPCYLSTSYLKQLGNTDIFHLPDLDVKDQSDIIEMTIALQTIIHLLDASSHKQEKAGYLFESNKKILTRHGVSFPFEARLFNLPEKKYRRYH
ncbi:DUF5365 family protein [Thalassobacillus devorans]|uniref:DUF5365 family protein n=1 Tax=Thalassobacillus devorans TaxID=279813 RepID=UPI000491D29C|nr:DUF5365 family protein [Thalassobacillus devorans]